MNPAVKDLDVRRWACAECGAIHDRDVNAAMNLCPDEARIQAARAKRLAEREVTAKKRRAQKARAAKAAITKKANAEAKRLAAHDAKVARHASRRLNPNHEILAVTPTDSNARRGPARPKPRTTVLGAAAARLAPTGVARTDEARTEPVDQRQVPADAISLGAPDPPMVMSGV